jgi:hypothetical protein
MIRQSARFLKGDGKIGVVLVSETENKVLDLRPAVSGAEALKGFLPEQAGGGVTNLPEGLLAGLALRPRTLVVFAAKAIDDEPLQKVIDQAKAQKTTVVCVILRPAQAVTDSLGKLAEQTGGKSKAFSLSDLDDWSRGVKD